MDSERGAGPGPGRAPCYKPPAPVPRKLDPYRVIMEEIRAAGYDGGYTQLKE
ncbi:MAG: hypothetical protein AMXMBFR53_38680 [Gemmatimonadota bacterium]